MMVLDRSPVKMKEPSVIEQTIFSLTEFRFFNMGCVNVLKCHSTYS